MLDNKKTPKKLTKRDDGILENILVKEPKSQKQDAPPTTNVTFEKMIINMDEELAIKLDQYIAKEKANRTKVFDPATGKEKRISKSLWVRNLIQEALKNE